MDKFFVTLVFFNKTYRVLDGICLDMYDIHSQLSYHIHPNMSMQFQYNQRHLSFFHNNMQPNVFSYKVGNLHDGNFFNIYVYYS